MSKKATIPDAWDDDWESQADKADPAAESTNAKGPEAAADGGVKLTKAERLAQHKENQKKIWENAQEPETPYFLSTRAPVPLTQEFKPALKLLSRKPTPNMVQKIDPLTGLATMTLEDEEEEEEVIKKDLPTAEELRAQREEKQRRYNEARARILGPAGGSMSGSGTPPEGRSGGKGRGGRAGGSGSGRQEIVRPSSSQSVSKDLYDPNYTPKPTTIQQRTGSGRSTPKDDDQIIRAPRGPDSNSRGFGFANRGRKMG
ncbi:uncharacterized protein L3040_002949 [Drepanopeziza brunnea f. sp. 'multigermtubi']|uniref:uncharacterized protein n=1 Tax=Drepanopeziza brunnea f. sp. 'multigermtubi' TaxID=698441 RepID=UPI002389ACB0|nr:hypothetical protein L3040_002949 [Drepanopeziza brunnea f. sp. 'multigermtubi']